MLPSISSRSNIDMIGGFKTPIVSATTKNQKKKLKVNYWKNKAIGGSKALVLESDIAMLYQQTTNVRSIGNTSISKKNSNIDLDSNLLTSKAYDKIQESEEEDPEAFH